MNFGELKTAIAAQIGRDASNLAYTLAQADIAKKLKLLEMETTVTLTASESVDLPSDFGGVIDVYLDRSPRIALSPTTRQTQNMSFQASGIPCTYAISGTTLLLMPSPSAADDLVLTYWAKPLLVDDTDENAILDNYPDLYVYGVLTHHAGLIRDLQAAQGWAQGYNVAIEDARSHDSIVRMSGGQPTPYVRTAP
jgi:hypothetical protein